MVVVSLFGGLGNQLFQYAAGRAVAIRRDTQLRLDVTAFEVYQLRRYGLSHFNIHEEFAYTGPLARFFGHARNPQVRRLRRHLPYFWFRSVKEEQPYLFDHGIFEAGRNVLLYGFWQNLRYFKGIAELLRREFTVRTPPDAENLFIADTIRSVDAVSVHVRRADYVTDADTLKVHGVCSADYYHAAAREVAASVRDPHFFVFCDDPVWAQANLAFGHPTTFVTHNRADRNYEDLRLITLCKHHIIANSTFSWWGAWLGSNPQRIVIAPARWVNDDSIDTSGLFPEGWRRVQDAGSPGSSQG